MRPQDAVAKIVECAPLLKPDLMRAKLAEFSKFGLPSGGSDGRGSAEKPLPMLGNTDRSILRARNEYSEWLTDAAVALERAVRLQRAWTIPRTDDTEKEKKLDDTKPGKPGTGGTPPKGGGPCRNAMCDSPPCTGIGNDRLRQGLCRPCYRVFMQSNGLMRDPRKAPERLLR